MKAARVWILSVFCVTGLTACFEDRGTEVVSVGTPTTEPPTFDVIGQTPEPKEPTEPGDADVMPVDPDLIEEGFLINGGAAKTASLDVTLDLITLARNQMKISPNANCEGGQWEPWRARTTAQLPVADGNVTLSVQYMDWDARASRCYRQSIIHDGTGPTILFPRYPAPKLEEGSTADIVAEIQDTLGDVKAASCALNGIEKPCFAGRNEISISALPPGDYEFRVRAMDDLGNESEAQVRWSVESLGRRMRQNIYVNDYRKVDLLIIIDNSGSMAYEQQSMGQRTSQMLSVLRGLDYQIAVTTTDSRNVTLGGGRFIPLDGMGGEVILTSAVPEDQAQKALSKTLQRKETGHALEQGILVTHQVIERYSANDNHARRFFRDGAQFAVLVISDEDESDNKLRNDPHNLLKVIRETWNGQKRFGFHSIITKPGDVQCRQTHGYAYGDRYQVMSDLTGGVIGSVCAMDYTDQVRQISEGVRDLLKTLTLSCEPVDKIPVTVSRDGVPVAGAFRIDGVNIKFDHELEPGDYVIEYGCLEE